MKTKSRVETRPPRCVGGWLRTGELDDEYGALVASLADWEWRTSLIRDLVEQRPEWTGGESRKEMAAMLEAIRRILADGGRASVICAYATAIDAMRGSPCKVLS